MEAARLFRSGRSQAVRLPKDYRFQGSEVAVTNFGNGVLLLPIDDPWATLEAGLESFEHGFVIERRPLDTNICIHVINARQAAVLVTVAAADKPSIINFTGMAGPGAGLQTLLPGPGLQVALRVPLAAPSRRAPWAGCPAPP